MKEERDIRDDEIRIIGDVSKPQLTKRYRRLWLVGLILVIVGIAGWMIAKHLGAKQRLSEPAYFEPVDTLLLTKRDTTGRIGSDFNSQTNGFCEIIDTTINDIPLRISIPHNAEMSLHVGRMNLKDTTVIYTAQAADVRRDNGKIVGSFVLKGEPLAWGLSKKGFCAVIDGKITIGVDENTPLFEEATERGGYFFRQYPLVKNGVLVENEPKNKSVRRAICDRQGEIFIAECLSKESFHDFAQALVDLGIDQAIYLIGSTSYGWAVDESGRRHEFGDESLYSEDHQLPPNISYIVWRKCSK